MSVRFSGRGAFLKTLIANGEVTKPVKVKVKKPARMTRHYNALEEPEPNYTVEDSMGLLADSEESEGYGSLRASDEFKFED
ncbi:hypothetical protein LUCX_170 [Xanthomonas phage vB_XciM_LucasX]|nr:hypothetical protein LUCX_170 [Xanthomonas phage vB_XciM_LucasX]